MTTAAARTDEQGLVVGFRFCIETGGHGDTKQAYTHNYERLKRKKPVLVCELGLENDLLCRMLLECGLGMTSKVDVFDLIGNKGKGAKVGYMVPVKISETCLVEILVKNGKVLSMVNGEIVNNLGRAVRAAVKNER